VQDNKYPVVSIPNGASGASKILTKYLDYLENFEEIILFFDNDEAGRKAVDECAKFLPPTKLRIASMGEYKDANEALLDNNKRAIIHAIWNPDHYKPDGLLTIDDIYDDVVKPVEQGLPWFIPRLTELTYGRRLGELHFLGAGTGVGKTDFITQSVSYDINELNQKVGVFFLEQAPIETYKRIAGKHCKKFFHHPDLPEETQDELKAELSSEGYKNLTVYDSFGVTDWDSIKSKIVYLVSTGVQIFYIDHLTALATGSDEKDEKTELERITAEMSSLCKKYNIYILVISHLATPQNGSHEEGARVQIRQFKGSRAIGFWAFFMFGLERNQQAYDEEERHTTTFRVLKDRFTGQATGSTIPLGYDSGTGVIYDKEGELIFNDNEAAEGETVW